MAKKRNLKLWFDKEGDFLEVLFNDDPGTFEETQNDQVMVRINVKGEVTGFQILSLSRMPREVLDLALEPVAEGVSD